MRLDYEY